MTPIEAQGYIVASVIATEVPPVPKPDFPDTQIALAIEAVAEVIRNRVDDTTPQWPNTAVQVVMQKNQFSAVCRQDYWIKCLAGAWFPNHLQRCWQLWQQERQPPLVPGALYYYSPISMDPPHSKPSWWNDAREVKSPINPDYFRFMK